jgi:FkbM family methyltransferase
VDVPHFRPGTDDDRWVIPELVQQDMYRTKALAEALDGVGGTILDCGAHIGMFAAMLAAQGVRQTIEAFEPEPNNFGLLVKNTAAHPNIIPRRLAVGDRDAERTLYDLGDTGRWTFVPPGAGNGRAGVQVRTIDLYRRVRDLGSVALLKLDLEGYEAELLNHMPADVLARVHLLLTEEHHLPIDYSRLTQAGFELWFQPYQDSKHRVYRSAHGRAVEVVRPSAAESAPRQVVAWRRTPEEAEGLEGRPWGSGCPAVAALLPVGAARILDLSGDPGPQVEGAEVSETVAGDLEADASCPVEGRFDAVVCGRVLEQVRDPGRLLRRARDWLKPGGCLVARLANVRHHGVLRKLLEGVWGADAADRSGGDRIRFFTRREVEKLFCRSGLSLEALQGVPAAGDPPRAGRGGDVSLGPLQVRGLAPGAENEFFASEYLIRAAALPPPDFGLTSIVVVVHNELPYTRQCVDGIRCFTDEPYEVIVVDNASTDGTPEYLRALGGVTLIRNETNRGFPAAANQGLQAARGRQVLLLNNDTVVTTGWLRRMLVALKSDPAVGLVGPCSNRVSGEQQVQAAYDDDLVGLDGFAWDWGKANDGRCEDTDRLVGFCLLIRREVVEKIGLLDERFGVGCFEDDDYCRRASQAGYRAAIARDAFVHHYGGRTFVGSGVDFAALMGKNQALFQEKWRSPGSAAVPPPADASRPPVVFGVKKAPGGGLLLVPRPLLLSLCMIVRDNAKTLEACLRSIRPWVDEMCVMDTGSVDETPQIAARLGARVFHFPWCDSFSAARNESLRHARGRWVFWMDSDDVISADNGRKLRALVEREPEPTVLGYVMQVHCPGPGDDGDLDVTVVDHVKLFRNLPHLRFEGRIHEQILPAIRRSGGETAWTDVFVVHSGYDHSPEGQERKKQRDLKLLHLELEERPEHPFTLFNLGMTYADIGEYARAAEFLTRSIHRSGEGESHLRKAYALLTYCESRLQHAAKAREVCSRGIQLFPEDAELRFRQAILLHEEGKLPEAVAAYREILDGPRERYFTSVDRGITGFKARQNLALVYADQGDLARAEEQWRLVVQEAPRHRPGWRGLGEVYLRRGKAAEAAALAEKLLGDEASRADGLMLRGQSAAAAGDVQEAVRQFKEAAAARPSDPEPLEVASKFLFERGRWAEAEEALKDLLARDAEDAAAHHNLGTVHARLGRAAAAAACYRRSTDIRPDSAATWVLLGHALRDAGRKDEAIEAWGQAVRLDPGNAEAAAALREARPPAP